jgi:two-component system CheB/CheR fusion protein
MTKSDQGETLAAIRQESQAGGLEPRRIERIAKDGRTVEVSLIVSALVDDTGKTYAIATTERSVGI